jgi:iron complex outermembrane receptor protein
MKISRSCILAVIAVAPAAALAQSATPATPSTADAKDSSVLGEIIVTAQKRSENVQRVPIAVTAISGDVLAARGIQDAQSFARLVPNMAFSNNYGQVRITLRGLSFQDLATQGGEPRVAYHVDGAFMAQSGDIGGTFYDIERVEVNRGPQGTLFGRNAIAGTVNVITRNPTNSLSGYLNGEVGNYSTHNLDGAISGPLADGLSARLAFQTRNHSGYEYNVPNKVDVNNQNTQAFRAKLKFDKLANFTAILSADYFREKDRDGPLFVGVDVAGATPLGVILGGQVADSNPRHNFSGQLPFTGKKSYGLNLDMNLDLGNGYSLASLTSYRHSNFEYRYDDTSSIPLIPSTGREFARQFSEELRLQKDFDRGNVVLGAYLYGQNYRMASINPFYGPAAGVLGFPPGTFLPSGYAQGFTLGGNVNTRSVAGFGQATYNITDTTTLIAGARYSRETKRKFNEFFDFDVATPFNPNFKHVGPTVSDSVTYTNFSPRVTLEQKIGPNQLIYVTFAKGFKAGGYNVGGLAPAYLPETLTDYEAGFKFDLFDRKVRINGAGFYYDYKDIQVVVAEITSNKNVNAASSKVYGAEVELNIVPVHGLQLDASAAILHSEFKSFDTFDPTNPSRGVISLAGNRLPFAPKYTLSYGAQYTFDTNIGPITVRGDGQSKSQVYFDQFNTAINSERASTILNASLGWKDVHDRLSATVFVKNITDGLYKNGTFVGGGAVGFPINGRYDPPRTYGVRFGVNF